MSFAQDISPSKKSDIRTVNTPNLEAIFSNPNPDPVRFVNVVLQEAVELLASDILFEPRKKSLYVRFRIDGVLHIVGKISLEAFKKVSARIKVLSNLKPIMKRKVQEGQYIIEHQKRIINLRVEIAQTIYGELIVIRVHERQTIIMELSQLGFNKDAYEKYLKMLQQRSGLILVCGPTGCGKTTTLYSTIMKLNTNQNYNIMTIEDPVEFQLEGINQMQVEEKTGFTFAVGLRTILRLSPDVILVGEIRDGETAKIAVESGLTGQLVLSTVHAEDSIGTLLRLLDLDIEGYLLNSSLLGIIAQRLVRKSCQFCKQEYTPTAAELDLFTKYLGRSPKMLIKSTGCVECNNLKYHGRIGIYEVLAMDAKIRSLIRSKIEEDKLRESLLKQGHDNLLKNGLQKCEEGLTTVEEVLRNSLRIN
ncbi:GspE/PulE family protein [Patescibacteria group bacterium]